MSVLWTRVRHPELGETVLPVAAVESCPGWEAVGEPTEDPDALRSAMAHEQLVRDAEAATTAPAPAPAPVSAPAAPKATTTTTESAAPSGADQKE